jgi:flagellar basal body rod protein FlgC
MFEEKSCSFFNPENPDSDNDGQSSKKNIKTVKEYQNGTYRKKTD